MSCEDYPCCGHDICPDFDANGVQLNMRCICGVALPINNNVTLCRSCIHSMSDENDHSYYRTDNYFGCDIFDL